jgi:hypothetical protein
VAQEPAVNLLGGTTPSNGRGAKSVAAWRAGWESEDSSIACGWGSDTSSQGSGGSARTFVTTGLPAIANLPIEFPARRLSHRGHGVAEGVTVSCKTAKFHWPSFRRRARREATEKATSTDWTAEETVDLVVAAWRHSGVSLTSAVQRLSVNERRAIISAFIESGGIDLTPAVTASLSYEQLATRDDIVHVLVGMLGSLRSLCN